MSRLSIDLADVDRMVADIAAWAYSDSSVSLPRRKLFAAVKRDFEESNRALTSGHIDSECATLVTGGDEGEPPEWMRAAYPRTWALLEKEMT